MTEGQSESDSSPPSGREEAEAQIFLCDPSAEAGRLLNALRSKGFTVVDVPLGLLANRTRHEVPRLIICDADAHEAYQLIKDTIESCPDWMKIMLIGHRDGALSDNKDLHSLATTAVFRPLDAETTARMIADLIGAPVKTRTHRPRMPRGTRAPRLVASARKPYRSDGRKSSPQASLIPQIIEAPGPHSDSRPPSLLGSEPPFRQESKPPYGSLPPPTPTGRQLSEETAAILEEGRKRMAAYPEQAPRPVRLPLVATASKGNVREAFLDALKEPLGDADELAAAPTAGADSWETSSGTRVASGGGETAHGHPSGGHRAAPKDERTNPGGRPVSQPPSVKTPTGFEAKPLPLDDLSDLLSPTPDDLDEEKPRNQRVTTAPPLTTQSGAPSSTMGLPSAPNLPGDMDHSEDPDVSGLPIVSVPISSPAYSVESIPSSLNGERGDVKQAKQHISDLAAPPVPDSSGGYSRPTSAETRSMRHPRLPSVGMLAPTGSTQSSPISLLAEAISNRKTGAVAQQEGNGVRRIVILDGDISTVSSSLETESLAHFLYERGDYSENVLESLGPVPAFGRHAGAALIARGSLQQEDLWPVLRAHAEWLLATALQSENLAQFESNIPARLQEEPSVFGGAAGTEVFIETIRRLMDPDDAFAALGSGERILGIGRHEQLIRESALSHELQTEVMAAVGKPLSGLMTTRPHLLPILYALSELDVLTTGGEAVAAPPSLDLEQKSKELDDAAFQQRVLARKALVEDGDYFSILGISRAATAHEVERAHRELLSEYTESRLTPGTVHLKEDLRLVIDTIDEAHMVLRDDVRRHRYRRALEAVPD